MTPGIDILNCGTGHTEIRFDGANPIDSVRAARIISDMLRRGYVLFVEMEDGKLSRVEKFDPGKCVYIIADLATEPEEAEPERRNPLGGEVRKPGRPMGRPRKTELPMKDTKVTAIARTAGG